MCSPKVHNASRPLLIQVSEPPAVPNANCSSSNESRLPGHAQDHPSSLLFYPRDSTPHQPSFPIALETHQLIGYPNIDGTMTLTPRITISLKEGYASPKPPFPEPTSSLNDVVIPIRRTDESGNLALAITPKKTLPLQVANRKDAALPPRVTLSHHWSEKENVSLPNKASTRRGLQQKSSRGSCCSRQSLEEHPSQTAGTSVCLDSWRRKSNRGGSRNQEKKHHSSGEPTSPTSIASVATVPLPNPTTLIAATPSSSDVTTFPSVPAPGTVPFEAVATSSARQCTKPEIPSPLSLFVTVNSGTDCQTEKTPFSEAPRSWNSSHLSTTRLWEFVKELSFAENDIKDCNEWRLSVVMKRMRQRSLPSSKICSTLGPVSTAGTTPSPRNPRRQKAFQMVRDTVQLRLLSADARHTSGRVSFADPSSRTDARFVSAIDELMIHEQLNDMARRLLAVHGKQLSMGLCVDLVLSVKLRQFRPEVLVQLVEMMDGMLPAECKTLLPNTFGQFILKYCKASWDSEIEPQVQRVYAARILGQMHGVKMMASVFIAEAVEFLRGSSTAFSQEDRAESINAILQHCHPSLWSEYPDIDVLE